jgi:hypothetical protein
VPGDHEQLASGLLPHTPVQPNQVVPSEPAGPGGVNPFEPASPDTASSAVPAGGPAEGTLVAPAENPAADQPVVTEEESTEEVVVEQTVTEPVFDAEDDAQLEIVGEEPPRSGKGSGEAAWRAFAEANGVQVSENDGRDEIIAACQDAGVIQ